MYIHIYDSLVYIYIYIYTHCKRFGLQGVDSRIPGRTPIYPDSPSLGYRLPYPDSLIHPCHSDSLGITSTPLHPADIRMPHLPTLFNPTRLPRILSCDHRTFHSDSRVMTPTPLSYP